MPVTLQSSFGTERYTTKERIEEYSGVPQSEISDLVLQDAEEREGGEIDRTVSGLFCI